MPGRGCDWGAGGWGREREPTASGLPPPGPNCEINLDDCASNPCDSGTCLDKIDGYECVCAPGYTGEPPRARGPAGLCPPALVTALPQGPGLCSHVRVSGMGQV